MRKIITCLFLTLITNLALSQELSVADGGSIFISSGDALYVNNNVNINASGSLIISSNETGNGSLLVSGTIVGEIAYQRYLNENGNGWHLVSSPVTSQSIHEFVTNNDNSIATSGNLYAVGFYDNTAVAGSRWQYYDTTTTPGSGNFGTAGGYSIKRTAAGVVLFEGAAAPSDVSIPITTASGNHFWSCVGNPFPAHLPANSNAAATNVLGQNIGILDPSFAALYFWNGTEYVAVNQISSATFLPPGQAFFVRANTNNESFNFSKSLTRHDTSVDNFNRSSSNTIASITVTVSNGSQNKTTEIKYLSNATTGLDVGLDAGAFHNGSEEPSFSLDTHLIDNNEGIDFTIQCLPDNAYETLVVPLSVNAPANQLLTFSAISEDLPNDVDVYIEDTVKNTFTQINDSSYEVLLNDEIRNSGRFYLYTDNRVLSTDSPIANSINIYKTDNYTLRITGMNNEGDVSIRMYNIKGQEVLSQSFLGENTNDIALPKSLGTGIYIVNVTSDSKKSIKKIIIE